MSLTATIRKVGGSKYVILPKDLAQAAGFEVGDEIRITLINRSFVLERVSEFPDEQFAFARAMRALLRKPSARLKGER